MSSAKPVIGITPYYNREKGQTYMPEGYVRGITESGCEMRVIDYFEAKPGDLKGFVKGLDGMLFSGGPDVEPALYGCEREKECGVSLPERDSVEFELMRLLLPGRMPIFGICRGIQLINAAMGGTLIQDVPTVYGIVHQMTSDEPPFLHDVILEEGSRTASIFGSLRFPVDSYHHQAIRDCAPGLRVTGRAPDGVIEAAEAPGDRFLVALQWHPEKTLGKDRFSMMPFTAFRTAIDGYRG